ncbi:MAG TPA: cyclopropane fatty acyl phospholipid synthase [Gammaproteobacteria bacterium]|nr:cyclopropane fatty acyl phospholipid synthase [Gammaproteobacteria bacterium]
MTGYNVKNIAKSVIAELLHNAGITINGNNSGDIKIYNEQFYSRILHGGSLALGEAYMDLWWDCDALDIFFERLMLAHTETKVKKNFRLLLKFALAKIINLQTKTRALEVGKRHYDLGQDLFKCMLDSHMIYTCGYWKNAETLDEAQAAKLDLTCRKLQLKPGMRFLDIGCGWGALAKYAAERYQVEVVGITISIQQYEYAKEICKGLPIEILFQDYRDLKGKFDRIASLGMFEHVGHLNYRKYMRIVKNLLSEDGIFLLHTIGSNVSTAKADEWIARYIFPNGMLPSIAQIGKATEGMFVMEDWHNFGPSYDKTLMAWNQNFKRHWEKLKSQYDERFYRMWNYYLLMCAGVFRAREMQLWQIVFSNGIPGGYEAPR